MIKVALQLAESRLCQSLLCLVFRTQPTALIASQMWLCVSFYRQCTVPKIAARLEWGYPADPVAHFYRVPIAQQTESRTCCCTAWIECFEHSIPAVQQLSYSPFGMRSAVDMSVLQDLTRGGYPHSNFAATLSSVLKQGTCSTPNCPWRTRSPGAVPPHERKLELIIWAVWCGRERECNQIQFYDLWEQPTRTSRARHGGAAGRIELQ